MTVSITEALIMALLSNIHFEHMEPWLSAFFDATMISLVAIITINRMVRYSIIAFRGGGRSEWSQLKIGAIVFAIEAIVMLTLDMFPFAMNTWQEILIDVTALALGSSLVIYAIVLRPASEEDVIASKKQDMSGSVIITNVLVYMCFMILLSMVMVSVYEQQIQQRQLEMNQKEANELSLIKSEFLNQLNYAALDTLTLAYQPDIQALLSGDMHAIAELQNDYLNITKVKQYYEQIRLLDSQGNELINIHRNNGQAVITPASKLQNKRHRYYFQEGFKLPPGGIYISPLDLNVGHDVVERPFRPIIRLVSPLFHGEIKKGLIIINLNGQYLLNIIERAAASTTGQLMLLNEDGYWLFGGLADSQWAFMFPDKREQRFQRLHPQVWEKMQQMSNGIIQAESGTFIVQQLQLDTDRIYEDLSSSHLTGQHERHWPIWVLISHFQDSLLSEQWLNIRHLMALLYLSILILAAIGTAMLTRAMIKRQQAEQQVQQLAFYDSLTGLANRRLYQEMLALEIVHARREQHALAVMYLDLDHFKPVNDELGHDAGDVVLKEVAERLRQTTRTSDTISRLGGDEFAIMLPKPGSESEIAEIAQRILESIAKPFYSLGHVCHLGISIGIGILQDADTTPDDLTRRADQAMYVAKHASRNCYRFAAGKVDSEDARASDFTQTTPING